MSGTDDEKRARGAGRSGTPGSIGKELGSNLEFEADALLDQLLSDDAPVAPPAKTGESANPSAAGVARSTEPPPSDGRVLHAPETREYADDEVTWVGNIEAAQQQELAALAAKAGLQDKPGHVIPPPPNAAAPVVPVLPPPGFEHLGFTVTPGTIFQGGSFPSIVPDSARALVDIRLLPGQSSAEVLELVRNKIRAVENERPRISFEMKVSVDIPGAVIPANHSLALLAQDYTEAVTGRRWAAAGAGPANEGYMLIGARIPTLCGFGPTGGNPHAPDEWVEIDSLPATIAMFAGIIHDYLNLAKENENVAT